MAFFKIERPVFRLSLLTMLFAISFIETAAAQVVIPYGDFDNDFEKYLVVAVSLAALVFAMWRYFRNRGLNVAAGRSFAGLPRRGNGSACPNLDFSLVSQQLCGPKPLRSALRTNRQHAIDLQSCGRNSSRQIKSTLYSHRGRLAQHVSPKANIPADFPKSASDR